MRNPFPIKDVNGLKAMLDNGKANTNYVKPPVLVGTCANLKADGKLDKNNKAKNGAECYLVSSAPPARVVPSILVSLHPHFTTSDKDHPDVVLRTSDQHRSPSALLNTEMRANPNPTLTPTLTLCVAEHRSAS